MWPDPIEYLCTVAGSSCGIKFSSQSDQGFISRLNSFRYNEELLRSDVACRGANEKHADCAHPYPIRAHGFLQVRERGAIGNWTDIRLRISEKEAYGEGYYAKV
jgi:hypothetical protein